METKLMDGIEVLNQVEIMDTPGWAIKTAGILMLISIVAIISLLICELFHMKTMEMISAIIGVICIPIIIFTSICFKEPTGKYEYQVLINENISMLEFYGKYEIIDQEGKIFTIVEKEKDEIN